MRFRAAALARLAQGVFAVSLVPTLVHGADFQATPLEETVITATRTRASVDDLAVPVIVITREEIERSLASDVGDLLKEHAGLEIARNGGPGQPTSLFIRGTNSDHSVVLIDGVRINPGTLGGAAIQNIDPETVERIEVVKGPRSTLYGSDAIGGVVNIFTRAESHRGLSGSASGGRYGTASANLAGGSRLGEDASWGFGLARLQSDGFAPQVGSSLDRGYVNTTANLFGEYRAGESTKLRARAWSASGTSEYSDFLLNPVDEHYANSAYALEAEYAPSGGALRMRVNVSRITDDIRQRESPDFVITHRNALDWQTDWRPGGGHEVTFGTLLTRENARSLTFGTGFDVDTAVNMGYLQDHWSHGRHDLLLAAGYTHHETFGGRATWNAEYGVTAGPLDTRFSFAAGTAFHAPDSTDRFGFGGNPNLAPEVSRQMEIGLRQPLGARQSAWITWFHNDVDNLINYVVTDFTTFDGHNENVERARIDGVEAGYALRGERWRLRSEVALQDPRNLTTGQRLLRRARETLTLSLERSAGRLSFGADLLASGARLDFGFPAPTRLAPYALLNFSARFAVSEQWSVQARLDNALDERYQLASGYNTARRSLTVATRYRFR